MKLDQIKLATVSGVIKYAVANNIKVNSNVHMHFLLAITAPVSSYSARVIHMFSKVDRDAKTAPPAKTAYLRSY